MCPAGEALDAALSAVFLSAEAGRRRARSDARCAAGPAGLSQRGHKVFSGELQRAQPDGAGAEVWAGAAALEQCLEAVPTNQTTAGGDADRGR